MRAPAAKPPKPQPQPPCHPPCQPPHPPCQPPQRTLSTAFGAASLSASAWVAGVADATFANRAMPAAQPSPPINVFLRFDMLLPLGGSSERCRHTDSIAE